MNVTHSDSQKKPPEKKVFLCMAGIPGLEPRLTESESAVLPLDDIPRFPLS